MASAAGSADRASLDEEEKDHDSDGEAVESEKGIEGEDSTAAPRSPIASTTPESVTPSTPGSSGSAASTESVLVALRNTVNQMKDAQQPSRQMELERLKT